MIRDTFFDLHRFVDVCRKEMIESWKANLLRVVLMYGVLSVMLVWNAYFAYYGVGSKERVEADIWSFGTVAFVWGAAIMGCLSASFVMERMKTKTNRLGTLMTPATMFEKFFARWVMFTFAFLVVYLVAYKLADWTRMLVYTVVSHEKGSIAQVPLSTYLIGGPSVEHWTLFENSDYFILAVSGYFFFQSCFVLGSSIWPKNAFLKTFTAGVIITIVYSVTGALLTKLFIEGRCLGRNVLTEDTGMTLGTVFLFGMTLFNWVLAYFRFKESEIINRW